ncbi:MAG: gliding motility-associated C-terminal domain-containing protein [Sediminibacterium sp.]|nr:gliding motility-associated C-terminal domain-containing protein [Sediminibacterium sp.]
MKKIIQSISFGVAGVLFLTSTVFAQTQGGFDRKAAEQKAILKNLPPQDVMGYVNALEREYNEQHSGHNHAHNHAPNDPNGVYTIYAKPGGGGQSTQSAGCPNASFENNNFGNWTGSVGNTQTCGGVGAVSPVYAQTAAGISSAAGANVNQMNATNYHTIMNIPPTNNLYPNCQQFGWDSIAVKAVGGQTVSEIPFVCPFYSDGTSVRMNGAIANYRACRMRYQFNLTPTNRNVSYAFAVVLYDGTHAANEQPFFQVKITDQNGNPIGGNCGVYNINATSAATDTSYHQSVLGTPPWNNFYYRQWKQYGVDLSSPIYAAVTQVNLEFTVGGCCFAGHWAYAYVDAECSQGGATNAMCAGTNSAIVTAPTGYVQYQWYGPNTFTPVSSANGGNTQTMTVNPAIVGQTYTVNMVTPTGCTVQLTNTIAISNVSITSIGSIPTCPGGSSGSANVSVAGSNNGYTFLWQNSLAQTVGTSSVATNLAPGVYSITVTGISCGQVTRTVAVGVAPPTYYSVNKSYCGNLAIISHTSGTNFQWYNNITPIPAPIGTAPSLTVTNPVNNSIYTVVYTTPQGCKDSIRYKLIATPPGQLSVMNIALICPGANTGTANVIISPAANAPIGQNTYSITGPSSYTAGAGPLTSNTFVPTGLSAGIYSVAAFDGSCFYNSTFTVTPYTFNYTVSPLTSTICQGGNITGSLTLGNTISGVPCSNNTGPACPNPLIQTVGVTNGQNGTTTWPAPYGNWYRNARHQMLFRATELTAMGIQAGYLTSLAFNVITINGTTNYPGYTIRMKCTPLTQLNTAAFDNTGLTQVYTTANYVVATGWNTHVFQTPYYWDGVSNLMVDICYNMTNPSYTQNSVSPWTTTAFASCIYWYSDTQPACMTTQAPFTWNGTNNRPVTRFGNCSGTNPSQFTYSWSPGPGIATPTQTLTTISPPAIAGTSANIVYSVQVTPNFVNCPLVQTITVTVINPLTPTITPLAPQCNTNTAITLSVTPAGGTWTNNPAVTPGGVFTPSLAAIGTSTVLYTVGVGSCIATGSTNLSVSQFNTANITGTVANLCITSPAVNLMPLVQSTVNGVWSGVGVTSNTFSPAGLATGIYALTYSTTSTPIASVCPASNVLSVSVTSTLTPTLTPIAAQCNTNTAITLTANPSGGTWYNNVGVSAGGILTPSLAPNGASNVTYSVNVGPCIVSNTMPINVSQFNSAALTSSVNHLCHTNPAINLMNLVQNNSGVWSGTSVSNNNFTPLNLATGIYNLTYNTVSTPNPNVCPHSTVIAISVLNPPIPTVNQVGPFCNTSSPVQLMATPSNGTWSTVPYLSNAGVFSPGAASIGNNVVMYTTGTNTCSASVSRTISIEAFVPATITGTLPDKCNTGTSENLAAIVQSPGGIWTGNGVSGNTFNPANAGLGQIVLTYNTASSPSYLCPDSKTIAVNVYSLATPVLAQLNRMCNTFGPKQIQASPVGGVFYGANNTGVTPEGVFNPAFGIIGANVINYSVTSGPCVATGTTVVDVEKFISADLTSYLGPYCRNNPAVNLNSIAQNPGGTWSGSGVNGSLFVPANANIGNNNTVVYSTHSMPTASLCPDSRTITIQVNDIPNVSIVSNVNKGCLPVEVTFSTPNVNTGTGTWNLGNGTILNGLSATHVFTTPGVYNVTFSYEDEIGCTASATLPGKITIFESPRANFDYTPGDGEITIMEPTVDFNNISTVLGNNTYTWTMAGLYTTGEVNPKVTFPAAGEYPITLSAQTVNGCKDQITKYIIVKNDHGIYIPNSFTPNDDGLNDVFTPVFSPFGLDLSTYQMEIFDRWGELLFSTKDFTIGWTGSKNNAGDVLKQDVYVYKIRYRDAEKKIYTKTGHVSLIK